MILAIKCLLTTPTLSLTATQYSSDTTTLGKISSAYNLAITAVTAANATSTAGAAHVVSVSVTDTAANISTNLNALQTLAASGKLAAVAVSNYTTAVSMTYAQLSSDATALGLFTGTYSR